MPAFVIEANYEFETNSGTDGGSPRILRMQEYWTMLSGAIGQLYGNFYSVRFPPSGWQNYLDSPGVTQLQYMANLFGSRSWYNLVPDQAHTFVTGGYGSYVSTGLIAGNNYVTAAVTPDGTLGMAYLPQGGTITVAMSKFRNNVSARWFDPSANTFTTITNSPFSNTNTQNFTSPGTNGAGNPDWVLVLETIKDPPTLHISLTVTNTALITWPGGILQQNTDLTTTNWEIVTNPIWVVSNEYQLLISPLVGQQFYRLASNSGTPSLRIFLADSNTAVVAWPGFMLQQNSDLITSNWINSTSAIAIVSNEYQVIVSPLLDQQFYRLFSH